jgi:hypothetical protein
MSKGLRIALHVSTSMVLAQWKYDGIACRQRELSFASFDGEGGGTEENIINVYV